MTLRELQEKRESLLKSARERLGEINSNTDESRTAELEGQHDAAIAEIDKLDVKIKRSLELTKREEAAARDEEERANAEQRKREARRPNGGDIEVPAGGKQQTADYDSVFRHYIQHGAADLNAEERGILQSGRYVPVQGEQRAQASGTGAAGGFTVPEDFSNEIDKAMAIWGPMWDGNIVREITTDAGSALPWPGVDDTAKTGRIKAENAAADDDGTDDIVFDNRTFNAYVYDTGIIRMPIELLQDSAFDMLDLGEELTEERLGRLANEALTTGTGSSQPQGIVTGAGAGITAAGTAALTSDEMFNMQHSVDPAYRAAPSCRWQFNDNTLLYLRKLKDGDGNYLWQMGDIRQGEPNQLLEKPYSVNQAMADIGAGAVPVIFGDMRKYIVRKVRGFTLITLRERYAENFQVGIIGYKRFDGRVVRSAAIKKLTMAAS